MTNIMYERGNRFCDKKVKINNFCVNCFSNIYKVCKLFSDYPETSQTIRAPSKLSRNFSDHPDTFQIIRKLSRLSGKFPYGP